MPKKIEITVTLSGGEKVTVETDLTEDQFWLPPDDFTVQNLRPLAATIFCELEELRLKGINIL